MVDGAAINERRLKELDAKKLHEIEGALGIVKRLVAASELSAGEAGGILEVITKYAPSFKALQEFDEGHISFAKGKKATKTLTPSECIDIISQLKRNVKGDELFGKPRSSAFEASLSAISQTFDGKDVYPSIAEKAANLLYFVIKDHPFYDGNKRIAAALFLYYLNCNGPLYSDAGKKRLADEVLVAITIMIAESRPDEKEAMVSLVMNFLCG